MNAVVARDTRVERVAHWCARYWPTLVRYFLRRVSSRAEAEDLAQDVFLRILNSGVAPRVDNEEAFVFTTALNLLRDRARRSRVQCLSLEQYAQRQSGQDRVTPERVIIGEDSLRAALASLARVDHRSRRIFELRQFEEKDYDEIAVLAGLSSRAVEKHMKKVRDYLERHRVIEFGDSSVVRRR